MLLLTLYIISSRKIMRTIAMLDVTLRTYVRNDASAVIAWAVPNISRPVLLSGRIHR